MLKSPPYISMNYYVKLLTAHITLKKITGPRKVERTKILTQQVTTRWVFDNSNI